MPAATNTCKGFIMAHQAPGAPADLPINPYAIVPCPHPVTLPKTLSDHCKDLHHCGYCKKACREGEQWTGVKKGVEVKQGEVKEGTPA